MPTSTTTTTTTCPECDGHATTTPSSVECVCQSCGLVVTTAAIDHGPEWRAYDAETAERTHPGDRTLADRGLGSQVGHPYEREGDHDTERLATWHHRARLGAQDRSRGYATGEITRIATALGLSDTLVEQARHLYTQFSEHEGRLHGRNLDDLAGGCVLAVCRIHQRGIAPAEVAHVTRASARLVGRRMREITTTLGVKVPPPDIAQRVRVVAREAGLQDAVADALDALDGIEGAERCRAAPSTLAAVLLYRESDATRERVCEAAACSPRAMTNARDKLFQADV